MKKFVIYVSFLVIQTLLLGIGDSVMTTAEAEELISIEDDSTGGDCHWIGDWDGNTRTCTLNRDISSRMTIDANGITIDGNGHTMTGNVTESSNDAITVSSRTGVTIKNIIFRDFSYGVHLINSTDCTVANILATGNLGAGISLSGASYNTLVDNEIHNNNFTDTGICIGYASTHNVMSGNIVTDGARGIYLHDLSDGNIISGNTLSNNLNALTLYDSDSDCIIKNNTISGNTVGVYLHGASNRNLVSGNTIANNSNGLFLSHGASLNRIYNNNFLDNINLQAGINGGTDNNFHEATPAGGNYWDDFDTLEEGCADFNLDSFCDAPYVFGGGQDDLPVTFQNEWVCAPPSLGLSVPSGAYWASLADYRSQLLTVEWKVTNYGSGNARNVSLIANDHSNGVVTLTDLPIELGNLSANGGNIVVPVKTVVPAGVIYFRSTVYAKAEDFCEVTHFFPGQPPTV